MKRGIVWGSCYTLEDSFKDKQFQKAWLSKEEIEWLYPIFVPMFTRMFWDEVYISGFTYDEEKNKFTFEPRFMPINFFKTTYKLDIAETFLKKREVPPHEA